MRQALTFVITLLCLAAITPPAHAAPKPVKAAKPVKERLVLMPLNLNQSEQHMQSAIETALVQGLQQKYEVFSGENVAKKVKEIFKKESLKKDCDETRCLQSVSIAFQAELIASASITKIEGGYLLALNIRNMATEKAEFSNSVACKGCDSFQVVDKLKELSGASIQPPAIASQPEQPAPIPPANKNDPEAVLWAEAQKGNTLDDYQVYLDSYPKGKYIPFAKARIKKINDAVEAAAEQQQQQAWDQAQQENSEASYSNYLRAYPSGRFAGFAKIRQEKLKNDVVAKEEAQIWNKADTHNDKAAIQSYLSRYPAGRHVAAAHAKLKLIKEEEAKGPAMVSIPGKNYELGKYEVTQKEWRDVMGTNPSHFTACGDTCPVEKVSWDDIQTFLQKLNAKTGRQYRLPTEAEWEYACYGGTKTEYCGGNDINSVAWYGNNGQPGGNSNQTTHPAGQKQANGYGLYDMSGNVWEWQSDCWEGDCAKRVVRGGSWDFTAGIARAADRLGIATAYRFINIGFRLARTLP